MKNNKSGKSGVFIVLLAAIILIVLVPWFFLISGILERNDVSDLIGEFSLSSTGAEAEEPDDEMPLDELLEDETAPTPEPEPVIEDDPVLPLDDKVLRIADLFPELQSRLDDITARQNSVSTSLVVFDGVAGEFFTYVHGYADLDARQPANIYTKYRVASLSKITTAICAMVLVDEGLIDLDADISIYLGYEAKNPNYPEVMITTRMLLQHTASFFDSGAFQVSRDRHSSESVRELIELETSFRRNHPGTVFEYTNFGYAVLGAVIENVARKTLDAYAGEVLFGPLGINAAYVPANLEDTENIAALYDNRHIEVHSLQSQLDVPESNITGHDLHLAQGNLTISVIDYARVLAMLGNGGMLRDVRILSREAVMVMHNTNVVGTTYRQGLGIRYSVGDFMPGMSFYWHTGSAYNLFAQFVYNTESGANRGVVAVTTGVTTEREPSGLLTVCNELSTTAWRAIFNSDNTHEEPDY